MSTEVAERSNAVPALAPTPAVSQFTADDLAISKIKVGQYMSKAVQNGLVKFGDVFATTGEDDPDPIVLWQADKGTDAKKNPGVVVHVLDLRKGKSLQENGELLLFEYDENAPPEASVTYNYTVALPEVDPDLPFRWLLTRTSSPAARKINTVLAKNAISGPAYQSAFRITTSSRENAKGKFAVVQVTPVEATPGNVEIAASLASLVAAQPEPVASTSNQPAI